MKNASQGNSCEVSELGEEAAMKKLLLATAAVVIIGTGSQAQAQYANAPAGYIDDLAVTNAGPTPANYTLFTGPSLQFTATGPSNFTTLNWAFRETPAYFGFDDVSVTDLTTGLPVTVLDPGFESSAGAVGTNFPGNGWGRWIQPVDISAIGEVASTAAPYGCDRGAHGGSIFWCDGSVEGYDGLDTTIATTPGHTYQVSFWLNDDSGGTGSAQERGPTLVAIRSMCWFIP